jgi:hypothetical protein
MAGNGNIVNVSSGLCVVTQNAATSAGTLGILYACTNNNSAPGDNEQWSYATSFNAPSSLYTNFGSFKALTSSGSNLVTGASSNSPGSLPGGDVWGWVSDLAVSSSGYGLLEDITQNQCLSASGSSVTLTTCVLSSGTATAQDWQQIGSGDGTALFQQAGTTNCLDVLNNINASGAAVGLYSCSTSYSNQQWTVVPLQSVPAPLSTDAFASGSSGGDWSVSGPNWAETGIASQSSTWSNGATSNASYAIDGNVASNDQHSNISATNGQSSDPYPWWQDDMGDRYPISAVNVYNRTDCCATNLSKFWVFTSNAPFNTSLTPTQQATQPGVSATYVAGPAGTPTTVAMPFGGVSARYIMIQLSGTGTLNLAEVTTTTPQATSLGSEASPNGDGTYTWTVASACPTSPVPTSSPAPVSTLDATMVPPGVSTATMTVVGGSGGNSQGINGGGGQSSAANGGSVTATFPVIPGQVITGVVGCSGTSQGGNNNNTYWGAPGWSDGGNYTTGGGGGGGSSAVCLGISTCISTLLTAPGATGAGLAGPVIIAGGGGGASGGTCSLQNGSAGGYGGGTSNSGTGLPGSTTTPNYTGPSGNNGANTSSSAGQGGINGNGGNPNGQNSSTTWAIGGGGGGLVGGEAGQNWFNVNGALCVNQGGAGGGSSAVSPNAIPANVNYTTGPNPGITVTFQ